MNHLRITAVAMSIAVALLAGAAPATSPATAAPATQPAGPAAQLFDRIKSLVGKWESEPIMGQICTVEYTLTGGGSAVVETMTLHGGMTTVYTLDGDRVLLTHYCAAKNQPRMESAGLTPTDTGDLAEFKFIDITGLPNPNFPHMHDLKLTFTPDGKLNAKWQMFMNAKPNMIAEFKLTRAK